MEGISSRLSGAHTCAVDMLEEIIKEFEANSKERSNETVQYFKFLIPLFNHPSPAIRKSTLNSSVALLANQPKAAEQLLDAYKAAMSSKDRSIAQQAISYLPQFVSVALDEAPSLIDCAQKAVQKKPNLQDAHVYIAQAIEAVKKVGMRKFYSTSATGSNSGTGGPPV